MEKIIFTKMSFVEFFKELNVMAMLEDVCSCGSYYTQDEETGKFIRIDSIDIRLDNGTIEFTDDEGMEIIDADNINDYPIYKKEVITVNKQD